MALRANRGRTRSQELCEHRCRALLRDGAGGGETHYRRSTTANTSPHGPNSATRANSPVCSARRSMRIDTRCRSAGDDAILRADLLFGRARAKERAGEFSAALRDLSIGLRLLNDHTTPQAAQARARLQSFAAMVQFGQDRPRRALARAQVAVAEARSADERLSLGRALIVLDLARTALEGPGDGAYLKEALEIFEAMGDLRMQANVRANLGFLNAHACRWDEADRMAALGARSRPSHRRFGRAAPMPD